MEEGESRNQLGKLTESICQVMPNELRKLIEKIGLGDDEITCVVADVNMGWALEVAAELGIRTAAFWPGSALLLLLTFSLQKLMDDGVIDENGTPIDKDKMIQLSPTTPGMHPTNFVWACLGDLYTQKVIFDYMRRNNKAAKEADWLICNSTHDFEPGAFSLAPEILPVGPVSAGNGQLRLVSIPDGMEEGEDRTQLGKLTEAFCQVMPRELKDFIVKVNTSEEDKITCVLADLNMEWAVDVAAELGIRRVTVWPASMFQLVVFLCIPKMINDGLIDENGFLVDKDKMFQVSPTTPAIDPKHFAWLTFGDSAAQTMFNLIKAYNKAVDTADWVLCNSSLELEPQAFTLVPKVEELLGDDNFKTRSFQVKEMLATSVSEGGSSTKTLKNFTEWLKS
ncbi:UDP-glucuronosyl/UDP-glucosyltransferase [Corchorus olitorius]|uniref:UDP-glucuronosyl/UDP-glucosyltransferase n=1 Tax=Corchorus olitorius TaxID=93759 RepID=A0A1R3KL74_9ROSI|nr:UDP-glucuronosyl/UDP-glucosyltransferase [Corchorus olitorius]